MTTALNAYLSFDGDCAEAMKFYADVLGAELKAQITYGQAPGMAEHTAPADRDRVMHAYLVHPDFALMAGDATSGMPYRQPQGFSMTLSYETAAEARRVFDALSAGGRVTMPLGASFWAEAFGAVTDRYGIPWLVNGGMKPLG